MKVWSHGLGRTTLDFYLSTSDINIEGDAIVILGKTTRPVKWEIKLTILPEDIPRVIKLALTRQVILFFLRYIERKIFQRKRPAGKVEAETEQVEQIEVPTMISQEGEGV